MLFFGTPNLSAASLFFMPFSMCHRMSHFSFKIFVFSLRLTDIFVLTTLRTKNRFFFLDGRNFFFDSNSNLFRNSEMKFEYVNVRDRERKWLKEPKNFFDRGNSSRQRSSKQRKAMHCSWGKLQGTEHFVRDRGIFEIEGSQDKKSPPYMCTSIHINFLGAFESVLSKS